MNYNVTLSKGAKAGKYYRMHEIHKMDECVGHCCGSKKCDVAFMVNNNCYLVKCHNAESCVVKQSENPKFDTMLSMVSKPKGDLSTKGKQSRIGYKHIYYRLKVTIFRTQLHGLVTLQMSDF